MSRIGAGARRTGAGFACQTGASQHPICDRAGSRLAAPACVRQSAIVPMRRSWTQIADELGLTREAVYRALATLERQKLVSRHAGVVCLTTPPE